MKTDLISVKKSFSLSAKALAIQLLKNEEVVAIPTETVYGLAACFNSLVAQKKIYEAKGRPGDNPLIVHIPDASMAKEFIDEIPASFHLLAKAFWPGPITIILKRKKSLSKDLCAGLDTIALRVPKNKVAMDIMRGLKEPLVAPSANLSGKPSPTTAGDVYEDLNGKIPLILDGGPSTIGIESTVVNLSSDHPEILRPGAVTKEEIEAVLGCSVPYAVKNISPGVKYRHYAPNARLILCKEAGDHPNSRILSYEGNSRGINFNASTLYASLREADRDKIDLIYLLTDDRLSENVALMNRIEKAVQN